MLYNIYCDESRWTKDRFMVIGGILIPAINIDRFNQQMIQIREFLQIYAQLKWVKVSKQKLKHYKAFIDLFFSMNEKDELHFRSIIIDNSKVDHKKYSKGDKEVGFYKFYYQLLLHCFGKSYCLKEDDRFKLFLHQRNTKYKLSNLKIILNNGLRKLDIQTNPFVSIEPKELKGCEILQLTDILIGAIGFQKNCYDKKPGAKEAKIQLAN